MPRVNGGSPGKPMSRRASASGDDHGPYSGSIGMSLMVEKLRLRSGARSIAGSSRSASQARRRAAHSPDRSVMPATLARGSRRRRISAAAGSSDRATGRTGAGGGDPSSPMWRRDGPPRPRAGGCDRRPGTWRARLASIARSMSISAGTARPPTSRTAPWRSRKRSITGRRTRRWRPGSARRAGRW